LSALKSTLIASAILPKYDVLKYQTLIQLIATLLTMQFSDIPLVSCTFMNIFGLFLVLISTLKLPAVVEITIEKQEEMIQMVNINKE
jgi:hypothetical protein